MDKAYTKNALIVGAVVLVAILLWFYTRGQQQAAAGQVATTPIPTGGPTFVIPGVTNNYGPVNFPPSSFNLPASTALGSLQSGNCSCGCSGTGGNTTVNFQIPGINDLLSQLAASVGAADNYLVNQSLSGLGYAEGVFVTDATPTPLAGGTFGAY